MEHAAVNAGYNAADTACSYRFQGKQSESLRGGWVQLRWVNVLPVLKDGEDQ
jgi:hypothetical protein